MNEAERSFSAGRLKTKEGRENMSDNKSVKDRLRPFYEWTEKIIMLICKILLIGDIAVTSLTVAGRYIPVIPDPYWGEEVVLTQMVYMAVLSATIAIRKKAHIRMTAFDKFMSPVTLTVSDMIADMAVFILGFLLLVYGSRLCASPVSTMGRYASMPFLSKFWQYVSVPVAGLGMVIFELEQILSHFEALKKLRKKEVA